jgi:hypothetical protein
VRRPNAHERERSPVPTLGALLDLSSESIGALGIARVNLLCQRGLDGTEEWNISDAFGLIDRMAARVKAETERHRYQFERDPSGFGHSEAFFRMVMMGVVLVEDFGIQYSPGRRSAPAKRGPDDDFFADPQMVFLSGLLGPHRQGTCSSLPVLYVAVGRQLGYPLKLVTTKGHLFVRWESSSERFNIEATGRGVNRFEDEYYRHWPFEISAAEEVAEGYLKSLSPAQELAVFLSIRGMCLRESGRLAEAAESFAAAARLTPATRSYRQMAGALHLKPGTRSADDRSAPVHANSSNSKL